MGIDVPAPDNLLIVGHIRRSHGLRGEVVVRLTTNRHERVDPGSTLWSDEGPMVVGSARPHDADFLVHFEGIADRERAESLKGLELRAEPIDDPDELWVHELIGGRVVDATGVDRGHVTEVHVNPASDLLVLDDGALVPVRFVTSHADGEITVDAPEGLFDL